MFEENKKTIWAWLLLSMTALVIIRTLPILKSPLSAYGYDFGFYYYAANHAAQFRFADFLGNAVWGGYNNPIFTLSGWLHIPAAIAVSELYFLASVALGLSLYVWLARRSRTAGIFAAFLLACSLVQTAGYLMFLWKNIVVLPLLVLSFYFAEEKKYWRMGLCLLGVLLLHRTTAVVCLLTLGAYFITELVRQKKFRLLGFSTAIVLTTTLSAYFFLGLKTLITGLLYNNNYYVTTGLFMEGENFWQIWWPFLILAVPGVFFYLRRRQHSILPIFTAILGLWITFHFPFYRRLLLYLDLSIIAFCAYFLSLIDYAAVWRKAALAAILAALLLRSASFTLQQNPLITPNETAEIKNFTGHGFVMAVSANDAPWLLAYTQDIRLGAPGLLEDPHTFEQWQMFWRGQGQRSFISNYPRPLYLYQRSYQLASGELVLCLAPVSQNFYEVNFDCLEHQPVE